MSDNLVIILQMVVAIGIVGGFVFCFPWNDFIALRERNDEQATRLENPAVNESRLPSICSWLCLVNLWAIVLLETFSVLYDFYKFYFSVQACL